MIKKHYTTSKRLNMVLNTICQLLNLLSSNTMMQNIGMTPDQIDQVCTLAIKQTAAAFGVTDSTVYSKCVREIGFSSKYEFVIATIMQKARVNDDLFNALVGHMASTDTVYDVERALGLPFGYAY